MDRHLVSGNAEDDSESIREVLTHVLMHCGGLAAEDRVAILFDDTTADIAAAFHALCQDRAAACRLLPVPGLTRHGQEPPAAVARSMASASLILSLCQYSLAHSAARIAAGKAGARFLSMPLYSWDLLRDPAIMVDYRAQADTVRRVTDAFTQGSQVRVWTEAGTDLVLGIGSRQGNACPGFVEHPGDLGSPPDIEANISPLETESNGRIVVDGSITCPEIGLVVEPVSLTVSAGRVTDIDGGQDDSARILSDILGPLGSPRRVVAELGVGLNPLARLTGLMLTDEGALGGVHFGLGANATVGGVNDTDFHLDVVVRNASLSVDGREILNKGVLV